MTTRFNLKSAIRFAMSSAVAWSLSLNLLRLGSGVILLPLLLTRLSGPDLGMYYVFARLIAITQILDFGFSFSFSRSVSFAMGGATELQTHGLSPEAGTGTPNQTLLWRLQSCAYRLYTGLGLAAFAVLATWGSWTIRQTVTETSDPNYTWLAWAVAALASSFDLYMGWWNSFLRSSNQVLAAARFAALGSVVTLVLAAILLWNGGGLLSLPLANLIGGLVSRTLSKMACKRLLDPKAKPTHPETWQLLSRIWPNSWRVGLQLMSVYLGTTIPSLHFAGKHGLDLFAPYGLSFQLMNISAGMATVWMHVKWPMVSKLRAMHDSPALQRLLWPRFWLQAATFIVLAAGAVLIAPHLLVWTGSGKDVLPADAFATLALVAFLDMQFSFWTTLLGTENRIPSLWPTVASQLAALGLYLTFSHQGLDTHWSLLLPPIIAGSLFNYWYWCFAGARSIGTSFFRFLTRSLPK